MGEEKGVIIVLIGYLYTGFKFTAFPPSINRRISQGLSFYQTRNIPHSESKQDPQKLCQGTHLEKLLSKASVKNFKNTFILKMNISRKLF